jgi:hypothetical protein
LGIDTQQVVRALPDHVWIGPADTQQAGTAMDWVDRQAKQQVLSLNMAMLQAGSLLLGPLKRRAQQTCKARRLPSRAA